VNAEDIAAGRWKQIRQAREQIRQAEAAQAASSARLHELRSEIPQAEKRDREALGAALVAGKAEPRPEAEQLRAELVAEERRNDALIGAVERARGEIGRQVGQHRSGWYQEAVRDLGRGKGRYLDAISELEQAREALSSAASLCVWVSGGGSPVVEAATNALSGRLGDASGNRGLGFDVVIAELRADAEHLTAHPVEHDEPASRPNLGLIKRAS
jgi:hypothetical protein